MSPGRCCSGVCAGWWGAVTQTESTVTGKAMLLGSRLGRFHPSGSGRGRGREKWTATAAAGRGSDGRQRRPAAAGRGRGLTVARSVWSPRVVRAAGSGGCRGGRGQGSWSVASVCSPRLCVALGSELRCVVARFSSKVPHNSQVRSGVRASSHQSSRTRAQRAEGSSPAEGAPSLGQIPSLACARDRLCFAPRDDRSFGAPVSSASPRLCASAFTGRVGGSVPPGGRVALRLPLAPLRFRAAAFCPSSTVAALRAVILASCTRPSPPPWFAGTAFTSC